MRNRPASICVFLLLAAASVLAQSNSVPLIYQTSPVSTKPGSKAFTLTIAGTGFASGAVVKWNGSSRKTTFVSSSKIQASISAKDVAKASTASVVVVNPAPGGGGSNVLYFPIRNSSTTVTMKDGTHSILPGAVTVGDFNNDGKLDVVVGYTRKGGGIYKAAIETYLGKGNGTFEPPRKLPHVAFPTTMVTGDFNGDGNLDLVTSQDYKRAFLNTFLGNGDGTFGAVAGSSDGGYVLTPADLNADGKLDLADDSNWYGDPDLYFSLGNGDGTFSTMNGPGGEDYGSQLAVGDFNGDGILDLAQASSWGYGRTSVSIYLGNGDGTFTQTATYTTPYVVSGIAAVDLNGDGILDLVTDGVSVLLGNGDGTFTVANSIQVASVSPAFQNVNVGDFNGDGQLDVAVVAVDKNGRQTIAILLGNGDGTFQTPIEFVGGLNPRLHRYGFLMGDFNNDGKLDLILEQELSEGHTHLFLQK